MRRKWIGTSMRKERTMRMSEKRMRTPKMTMRSTEKMIMIIMTVMIVMIVMIKIVLEPQRSQTLLAFLDLGVKEVKIL